LKVSPGFTPALQKMTMPSNRSIRMFQELAYFRHRLRKFLRFSEQAARAAGITPQQHQLMLGIAGFTGTGTATISDIAEFLQERHNSVVGLIDRAAQTGLVQRTIDASDRRIVVVSLTERGEELLRELTLLHREEVKRLRQDFLRTDTSLPKKSSSPSRRNAERRAGNFSKMRSAPRI
jgi:DNA-binding MarR family transcriptional regulator